MFCVPLLARRLPLIRLLATGFCLPGELWTKPGVLAQVRSRWTWKPARSRAPHNTLVRKIAQATASTVIPAWIAPWLERVGFVDSERSLASPWMNTSHERRCGSGSVKPATAARLCLL